MIDVCLLGTGGMMPLPNRWLASALIKYNGNLILIDCGESTQIPLKICNWGIKSIEAICITHYHADHISGLPGLLLTISNAGREDPLVLIGPPGLESIVKGLTVIAPELNYDLKLIELSDTISSEVSIQELSIKSLPVDHSLSCLAYSIELNRIGKFNVKAAENLNIPKGYWSYLQKGESVSYEGKIATSDMVLGEVRKGIKLTYCTDTRPTSKLYEFAKDSDLLICEGIYGDDTNIAKMINRKHMIFREAATIASKSNVKELWLTHYSPALTNPEDYIDFAREIFKNTYIGKDLLKKTFTYE